MIEFASSVPDQYSVELQIRGEFMRASRILAMRPRAITALSQLCEEKVGEPLPPVPPPSIFVPPRLSVPAQVTHSAGNSPTQSKGPSPSGRLSLRPELLEHAKGALTGQCTPVQTPPEHMAPKRSRWTSPPPPEAPPAQHAIFEDQFDQGLALATSSSDARENSISTRSRDSTGTNSDEERRSEMTESDDVTLVSGNPDSLEAHCPMPASPIPLGLEPRGRLPACPVVTTHDHTPSDQDAKLSERKVEPLRRSHSGPPDLKTNRFSWPSTLTSIYPARRPSHISHHHPHFIPGFDPSTVFYETAANNSRFPHLTHLQLRQHSVGAYPHHLSSAPRYDHLQIGLDRQRTHRPYEQPPDFGTNVLEHELSAIQLSGERSSDVGVEHGQTGDGQVERSLSQTNAFSPSHTPHRHTPTLSTAHPLTCDAAATTSPDSRSMPLVHQRNVGTNSRSTSHSPLRASIHHRMATTPTSPSLPSGPASHSGASTPSSTSVPPSPSHQPRSHEEPPRYSSPLSQMETKLNSPNLTDHKLCRGMGYHGIASNPITGGVDLSRKYVTKV